MGVREINNQLYFQKPECSDLLLKNERLLFHLISYMLRKG